MKQHRIVAPKPHGGSYDSPRQALSAAALALAAFRRRSSALLAPFLLLATAASCTHPPVPDSEHQSILWRFDQLSQVGGAATRTEGDPELIVTRAGSAIRFDGEDDALFIERHPLASAGTFTIEAIFRPEGGAFEQRWLHLAEAGDAQQADVYPPVPPSGPRFLFEVRVVPEGWYLDAFTAGPGYSQALMDPEKLHRLGEWHHVAQTYDGQMYRSYVNGVLQAEAPIAFVPQGPGYSSIGTRINRRDYFTGAVYSARFTPSALPPSRFMKIPAALRQAAAGAHVPG